MGNHQEEYLMSKLIRVVLVVLVMLTLAATPSFAAEGPGGFRALAGQDAVAFRLPNDITKADSHDVDGLTAERYQQHFGNALVLGGQITVYRDAGGKATAVIGAHYPTIAARNQVNLSPAKAQAVAAAKFGSDGDWSTTLMIDPTTGIYFYKVETRGYDFRWFAWVNANTGEILKAYDGLTTGIGIGVLGDTKDMAGLTTYVSGVYQLKTTNGRQTTYDARNRSRLPGTLATDADDNWILAGRTSPGQPAMVDAHFYANVTDNYYLNIHGFNWITYYSQGMVSSAHLSSNYVNAYWNGTQMAYGDGDGVSFLELSGDLDVVAHELTHGVTEATSDLIYADESGALNEGFSDIMAAAVEFYNGTGNWTVGEDITVGDNGIRNMADPNEDGDPSHYADLYTGSDDNGGVHTNNGVANHWFYLLTEGGQNANPLRASGTDVIGIGITAAEDIAFAGFTALPEDANYCAARASTIAVAGSYAANVADAWDEVGVDEALCGGGGGGGEDTTPPVISNVASARVTGNGLFRVTWTTDEPATSQVAITNGGTYTNSSLVTSHSISIQGSRGVRYEYYVTSVDAAGNSATAGPFYHQN
jgi:bacillolysin